MKKKCIMALIIGAAFLAQGCGYEEGTDAVVTVVDSTPTPEPTEKPKATATPTPKAAADSTADGADPKRHQRTGSGCHLLCSGGCEFTF